MAYVVPEKSAFAGHAGPARRFEADALTAARLLWVHVAPTLHRFRRGEGQLLLVNASLVVVSGHGLATGVALSLYSALVLALLYLVNDLTDAPTDANDPHKDQTLVWTLVQRGRLLSRIVALEHCMLPLIALWLFDWTSAVAVAGVLAVNLLYSGFMKRRAFFDVPVVALWGALFALTTGKTVPWTVYAVVGFMTAVTHVFQITRDRRVNTLNGVKTSAVAIAWLPIVEMGLACSAMGFALGATLGAAAGLSALVPLVLYLAMRSNQLAWLLAKGYFGVVWLVLLGSIHAT